MADSRYTVDDDWEGSYTVIDELSRAAVGSDWSPSQPHPPAKRAASEKSSNPSEHKRMKATVNELGGSRVTSTATVAAEADAAAVAAAEAEAAAAAVRTAAEADIAAILAATSTATAEAQAEPPSDAEANACGKEKASPLPRTIEHVPAPPAPPSLASAPGVGRVPFIERPAVLEERRGEIEYRVVNNDGARESHILLAGLKGLFQKQLPKMPKDYIARLVYDRTHLSMAIVKQPLEVLGGIAIRPFANRGFAEIVFCAVSSDQQVKGYGAHMMAHMKDYVRATSPVMHSLTYADNYATGYFQKQGFTKIIDLPRSVWSGYIKDYEGGTLMQCSMLPRVRYLEAGRMLRKQKENILAKIRVMSKSHIVHPPPAQWANGVITPIDPLSIPAIRATGWSPHMDELSREPRHGPHFNELRRFLYQLQNHKQAWPFLSPVNKEEVPEYYKVIEHPIDLSIIEERLMQDHYAEPKELISDVRLMLKNCCQFNDSSTVYNKCAVKMEKFVERLIKDIPEWHNLLDE